MNYSKRTLLINDIKLPIDASSQEAFSVAKRKLSKLGINSCEFSVFRRSIDARKKDNILFVYSIAARGNVPSFDIDFLKKNRITELTESGIEDFSYGEEILDSPPVVVGSGPCGLFAALLLAEAGYAPIIIERGGSVKERKEAVERFNRTQILSTETNIQFGAGGAGTFSDGKLVTRINDSLTGYVLDRFIEFGAPEEIRYIAKPHIGTDILSLVVENMIERICELGGKILYHTKFLSAISHGNGAVKIKTTVGDMNAGALILALGHSARDTYESLIASGFSVVAKSFSVGMRIEHLAADIDKAMYGNLAGHKKLGHAEYTLAHDTMNRGTYTFCMCPGGEVVAAASEEGGVVVNGMSYNSRSGKNSNSAVVATVFREDYGDTPLKAIEFQRNIEKAAFIAGGKNFAAPIITVGDFLSDKCKNEPNRIFPTYMQGENVKLTRPENYLPSFVCQSIKGALLGFDKKIEGFAARDAILTGAETRTSAPIRILRDDKTRLALGYNNIYPAGEGAGYAGGITSASVDGIKTAIALMKKYKPIISR